MVEQISSKDANSWINLVSLFMERECPPSYAEVCELALTSPALNCAFAKPKAIQGMERSLRYNISNPIEFAHGLKPWFAPEGTESTAYEHFIPLTITCAETNTIHFEALLECCGRILKADVPLQSELREWLAQYLLGKVTKPSTINGPSKLKNIERDFCIRYFLSFIDKLDYPITENNGTFRRSSACHAISDAWGGRSSVPSVKRLMNIWSER